MNFNYIQSGSLYEFSFGEFSLNSDGYFTNFVVYLEGCGYGQAALQDALEIAQKRKLKRVWLVVKATNANALHIYRKFGFKVIEECNVRFVGLVYTMEKWL